MTNIQNIYTTHTIYQKKGKRTQLKKQAEDLNKYLSKEDIQMACRYIGKDPDAGKDWAGQKRATEDEMIEQHHQLNEQEFEQTLGDSEGQGSMVYGSQWGCKDWKEFCNWTTATTGILNMLDITDDQRNAT